MNKEEQWRGYYQSYFSKARQRRVQPVQILDEEWFDGCTTAMCVTPYLAESAQVLEIACGIGRVSRFVAPRCGYLHCTDILDEALAEARNNLADYPNVGFHKTNGYDLSIFDADRFDCVYSFTAFFHFDFELVVNYFAEIKRVLKPGGVGIIEFKRWTKEEDVQQLLDKIEEQGGIQKYERELDKWRYVSRETLNLLCGFYRLKVLDDDVTKYTFRKQSE